MRYTKPQPPMDVLREQFDYRDDAMRRVNGFVMRGGLMRLRPPTRVVCGVVQPGVPTSRAQIGVYGWGVHALHRVIWMWHHGHIPDDLVVDHIDNDPSNNRIVNLRLLSDEQNQMNRRSSRKDSTVPYIGVCRTPWGYNAFTSTGSKPVWLGQFTDPIEAALARDKAAERKAPGVATLNRDLFPEVRAKYHPQANC